MITRELVKSVKLGEGLKLKPYRCSAGKLTIGFGRNLDDVGITEEEAEYLLMNDLKRAENDAKKLPGFDNCSQVRRDVLIEMVLNLGLPRVLGFRKMLAAVSNGDYAEAARQMLDSKWHKDVGNRADRLAWRMEHDRIS